VPIALTEEQTDLAASVAGFVERHAPSESTRAALDALAAGARPDFWDALVAQGLPSLHLPEDGGGGGGTGLDLAVAVEETGRGLLPGPFLPTVLTGALLTWYGDGPSTGTAVKRLAEGARATCALSTDGLTARRTDSGYSISGTTGLILAPSGAEVLLLGAALDDSEVWFVVEGTDVHIEPATGVDLTRGLGRLSLRDLRVDAGQALTLDASRIRSVAAALFSAEAVGLVRWCVEQGLAYAKTREQFGRPIGSFQAIKHKCARMFVELETMTASAWDAARALDDADDVQLDLAAAGAAAVCLPAARRLALETITLFGGIGYTWEHDAHLYWRRAVSLESLLSPITGWQRHLGDLALHAERDFTISVDEDPGFRDRIAALLASAAALDEPARRHRLAETGLVAPHFPEPYGLAATATQQIVIAQEYEKAGLTQPSMVVGDWAVPTILTHGTPEQIETFVPPTLRGERVWCQLFSEPGAGSDLASLRTRASKVDGGWRINGQKVWTSQAHEADWAICLARTDPDVPKHKGLSYFLVDMRSEGVEVRPLREANGEYMFNEVFLNEVFVPDNRLVAEPGQGWTLARTTLGNERVSIAGYAKSLSTTPTLAQAADTPDALRELGELTAQAQAIAALSLRSTLRSVEGLRPGAEASVAKVATAWHTTAAAEKALQWAGPAAAETCDVVHSYLSLPAQLLGGGTLEIQLNVISERILGLPREHHPR
jgi:alkylation response protein AidB-like acyl-CoA dehydrogenase